MTADKKTDGKIPKSFPGAIAIAPNYKTKKFLDNNHQQCGEDGIEEYMHFVEHLLERVNPTQTKFGSAKTVETISSCFTTPDEAFASMVLDNKLHVWDAQHEKTRNNKGVKGSQLQMKRSTAPDTAKTNVDGPKKELIATTFCMWKWKNSERRKTQTGCAKINSESKQAKTKNRTQMVMEMTVMRVTTPTWKCMVHHLQT